MTLRRWLVMMVAIGVAVAGSVGPARAQAAGVYFNRADNTTVSDPVLNVSVMVCAPTALIYFTAQHFYAGGNTVLSPSGGSGWMSCDGGLQAQPFDVSMYLMSGVNQLWIDAGDGLSFEQSVGLTITLGTPEPPEPNVEVATSMTGAQMTTGATVQRRFTISNPRSTSRTFSLSVTCGGVVTCTGMSQPSAVTVAQSAAVDVFVSYSVNGASAATGTLTLTAMDNGDNTNTDFAAATVQIIPRPTIATRSLCLSMPAGPGASVACGSLRLSHSLPGVRTYSTVRAPVLTYESQQANPRPILSLDATLPLGQPVPDWVVTTVFINNAPHTRTVAGNQFQPGQTRRAVIAIDLSTAPTGLYDYTIEVRRYWSGTNAVLASSSGSLPIVNRGSSPFGAGWWLSGIEQLQQLSGARKLWIGGDGSARVYEKVSTVGSDTIYMAARQTYSDTLRFTASDASWRRRLPSGGFVKFDAQLKHVATTNRLAQSTTIAYDGSSNVSQITVPPSSAALTYVFAYTSGKIDSITVPDSASGAKRVTQLTVDGSGRLTNVYDPGLSTAVVFGYDTSVTKLAVSRTDRRNGIVLFAYDSTQRVAQAHLKLNSTESAVVSYCVGESMGLTLCQNALVAPTNVRTIIDGARTDSADVTTIWIDALGAPTRIENAIGANTSLARGDARFPALPTRMQLADGHITSAVYDERGNLSIAVDSSLVVGGVQSTTRYEWHSVWNQPTLITSPAQTLTRMDYDGTYGTLSWQEDGRGSATRTGFEYDENRLLRAVVRPDSARDSLFYDGTRYNVSKTTSPVGRTIDFVTDAIGRVTVSRTAIGGGLTQDESVTYDRLSRVVRQVSYGPAVGGDSAKYMIVTNAYDDESNLDSLTRSMVPALGGIGALTTSWAYDFAGRRIVEVAPGGARDSTQYDVAGNPTVNVTRRGGTIAMSFDRLNRLSRRTASIPTDNDTVRVGAATTDTTLSFWSLYGNYSFAVDTATFWYDNMSRDTLAVNQDARVRRSYTAFGALATDTLYLRTWSRAAETKYGLRYDYDIAGRVTTLWYPSQLTDSTRGKATYFYDVTTGFLSEVRGLQNEQFTMAYNNRSELTNIALPGNIAEFNVYDADGMLTKHGIRNLTAGSLPDRFPYSLIDSTDIYRNLRGGVDSAYNRAGPLDRRWASYGGLGQVRSDSMKASGKNMFNATISATVNEGFYTDAMGNIHSSIEKFTQSGRLASSNSMSWTTSGSLSTFDPVTSRLTYKVKADSSERQWFWYDQAGNMKISSLTAYNATSGVPSRYDDLVSYYNTLGQLVGAERRTATRVDGDLFDWRQLIETYRYDPLGRRVVVRGQIKCPPYDDQNYGVDCFTGTMRRTVWAGDQELVEIQRPDSTWAWPVAQSLTDSDTALVALPRRIGSSSFPQNYDPNPQFGRIAYVHALGLDRPLSFTRFGYHDKPIDWVGTENGYTWPPITVVPHWNSRGEASTGTFMNGAARKKATPHSTHVHEFAVDWELGGLAYGRLKPTGYPPAWNGTLLTQKRDLTGTLYRRNRYYDPASGRFTQQDPIGLAGGLNLYGFAGGDPINGSDPFGLEVILRVSAGTMRQINEARKDSAFNADWEAMVKDTATFLIYENTMGDDSRAAGGIVMGVDMSEMIQDVARMKNVQARIRGYVVLGTGGANPGSPSCTAPHELIHLKGLFNGGTSLNSNDHADFGRAYLQNNGCNTHGR